MKLLVLVLQYLKTDIETYNTLLTMDAHRKTLMYKVEEEVKRMGVVRNHRTQ